MCIINEPAEVHETEILVSPHSNGTDQLTVYANNVQTESNNNMMLLPVPYPNTVEFINLENYQSIFKDLEKSFDKNYGSFGRKSKSRSLGVVDVGSYKATLVPTHADLDRIDPDVFGVVQNKIKVILKENYQDLPSSFGYIICKLNSGTVVKYHPFAYKHKMVVNKEGKKVLFIPTRHEHGDKKTLIEDIPEADWDHAIYSLNTSMQAGNRTQYHRSVELKMNKVPKFDFGNIHTINKKVIKGVHANNDLIFDISSFET